MNIRTAKVILYVTTVGAAVFAWGNPGWAQEQPAAVAAQQAGDVEEIVVTSRKRPESILNVPIVEAVIPKVQLEGMQITSTSDLAQIITGTTFAHGTPTTGTQVSIRGIGTITYDLGVPSSISLNIDGLTLTNNVALQSGLFDLDQIEVLKGPQALFYGKSSPGGVISLHTADPTDRFEVIGRESYDAESVTPREELIVSGPVTDTLKLRLAGMYETSEGYFNETAVAAPGTGGVTPTQKGEPNSESYIIRGTALWDPVPEFDARLKLVLVHQKAENPGTSQLSSCPEGPNFAPSHIPFIGTDDCTLNRNVGNIYMNPANFPAGLPFNGVPTTDQDQRYGTLELNYRPIDDLTLTSVTAHYQLHLTSDFNATNSTGAGPAIAIAQHDGISELTEEVRANSAFSGPLNFTAGGLYEDGQIDNHPLIVGNSAYRLPAVLSNHHELLDIETRSVFGQVRWALLPQLELAGGVRWTDETRPITAYNLITGTPVYVPLAVTSIHSSNLAPEFTLTYKPADNITLFGSYKQAYKSGSYSLGTIPAPGINTSFGEEEVEGEEFGLKSRLFDHRLAFNVAGYYYDYSGLQVGAIQPAANGVTQTVTINAGAAHSYGLDMDAAYHLEAVPGLTLTAAANWDLARYLQLNNVPCWGGQTIAAGCTQELNRATGLYTAQNLSGTQMIRAPKWQFNLGFNYDLPIGGDYTIAVNNTNAFSSKYPTFLAVGRPNSDEYQGSFVKVDLSLALQAPDDRWELALIGKDINDAIVAGSCSSSNFANGAVLGGEITGGTGVGRAKIDQVGCFTEPGREVWVRLTVKL